MDNGTKIDQVMFNSSTIQNKIKLDHFDLIVRDAWIRNPKIS